MRRQEMELARVEGATGTAPWRGWCESPLLHRLEVEVVQGDGATVTAPC